MALAITKVNTELQVLEGVAGLVAHVFDLRRKR
jgi:hypothetical protein